ncbi:unnamed protein product [Ectocarpus sp. 12 AP-2014]
MQSGGEVWRGVVRCGQVWRVCDAWCEHEVFQLESTKKNVGSSQTSVQCQFRFLLPRSQSNFTSGQSAAIAQSSKECCLPWTLK